MEDVNFSKKQRRTAVHSTFSRVVKNSRLQKSLPTWLVWAGYSVWHFFTDGVF